MDTLVVYQATLLVLSDWPTKPVDAIFFHGRSFEDDDNLFELAADLQKEGLVKSVVLNGSDGERAGKTTPGEAWPGKKIYTEKLSNLGVGSLVYSDPAFTTRQENEAFVDTAKKEGWKSGVIMTQPHQALRAMLGMVKVMSQQGYQLAVYIVTPRSTSWWKQVYGSQGSQLLPRFEHINEELRRIRYFQEEAHLARFEELFDYFEKRDAQS